MCIIVYHPKGAKLPSKSVLQRCQKKNEDGAGLQVRRDGWIRVWKGFLTWEEFWQAYRSERLSESDEFALHFRLATSGGVTKGNCHPFPLSPDRGLLKRLKFRQRDGLQSALMHNGVLGKGEGDLSDTMVYIRDKLVGTNVTDVLKGSTGNKFLLFNGGEVVKEGFWNKDDDTGLWFSNYGWKDYSSSREGAYPLRGGWGTTWGKRSANITCPVCLTQGKDMGAFSVSIYTQEVICFTCGLRFDDDTGKILGFVEHRWDKWCREESLIEPSCRECTSQDSEYCGLCYKLDFGLVSSGRAESLCEVCKYKDSVWCEKCKERVDVIAPSDEDTEEEELLCYYCLGVVEECAKGYYCDNCEGLVPLWEEEYDLYCCGCGASVEHSVVKDMKGFYCTICKCYVQVDKLFPAVRRCVMCQSELGEHELSAWCEKCRQIDWCPFCGERVKGVYGRDDNGYIFKCSRCLTIFHENGEVLSMEAEVAECKQCGAKDADYLVYNAVADDHYCLTCNRWLEEKSL